MEIRTVLDRKCSEVLPVNSAEFAVQLEHGSVCRVFVGDCVIGLFFDPEE
jgi:hypothetical protein